MAKAWKIAPGKGADHWEMCREKGCILIGWRRLKDYRKFKNHKQILKMLGGGPGDGAGAAQSILRFVDKIQPSDVVVANKGRSGVVGIGVVKSDYLSPTSPENPGGSESLPHARLVDWVIDQPIDLEPYFFGMSTVHSLTAEKLTQIKQAYLKKFPKLKVTLNRLFDDVSDTDDADDSATNRSPAQGDDVADQIAFEILEKSHAKGQGFLLNKKLRLALEKYAMDAAKSYFLSSGFVWEDHSKNHPYDLRCRRGKEVRYVEVKGTQTNGEKIILTNGEVEFARRHKEQMALFILHSINAFEVRGDFQLKEGKQRLILPLDVNQGCLSPLSFMYQTQDQ